MNGNRVYWMIDIMDGFLVFIYVGTFLAMSTIIFFVGKTWRACLWVMLCGVGMVFLWYFYVVLSITHHIGPPDWNRQCEINLKELSVENELIDKVICGKPLSRREIKCLLDTKDNATYCLLVQNDSLSDDELEQIYQYGNKEVKDVLVMQLHNPNLRMKFKKRYETDNLKKFSPYLFILCMLFGLLLFVVFFRYIERISDS